MANIRHRVRKLENATGAQRRCLVISREGQEFTPRQHVMVDNGGCLLILARAVPPEGWEGGQS